MISEKKSHLFFIDMEVLDYGCCAKTLLCALELFGMNLMRKQEEGTCVHVQ